MPRGNRGQRNGDDGDDERQDDWGIIIGHLEIFPKFEGKGEQPSSHLMEFEDYLVASGVAVEEDEDDPRVQPRYIETSSTNSKHHLRTMQGPGISNRWERAG